MKTVLTLCMIHNDTHILLGKKKRGLGTGLWNGFGGHVEQGETIEQAAAREVREEIGVMSNALTKRGMLDFEIATHPEKLTVHVFSANEFDGEPRETEEMEPRWFTHTEIPYDKMWADDKYWLPLLLRGKYFVGKFQFDDIEKMRQYKLREVQHEYFHNLVHV